MTQVPLFDAEPPPARCRDCGGELTWVSLRARQCKRCGWRWERPAQIAPDEAWPEGLL